MLDEPDLAFLVGSTLPPGQFWKAPLIYAVGSGALLFITAFLWARVCLREFHDDAGEHWTEKARYADAVTSSIGLLVPVAGLTAGAGAFLLHGPLTPVPLRVLFVVFGFAGFVGAFLGVGQGAALFRGRQASLAARWRSICWWLIVLKPVLLIWGCMFFLMPGELGPGALGVFLLGQLMLWAIIRGWHFPLLRMLGVLKPTPQDVVRVVQELAREFDRQVPRCYEFTEPQMNAIAFPRAQALGVTTALLQIPREELRAVLAHEFGHLSETRRSVALRWLGGASAVSYPLVLPTYTSLGLLGALAFVVLLLASVRLLVKLSVRLETEADEVAAKHEGDEGTYARALERIHRFNLAPAVALGEPLTHPHLYDRMLAAGVTPDYPRPAPPSMRRRVAVRLLFLVPLLVYVCIGVVAWTWIAERAWRDEGGALAAVTFTGGAPATIYALAWEREVDGEFEQAIGLLRAANELLPDPRRVFRMAILLDMQGRRNEGLEPLRAALELGPVPPEPQFHLDLGLFHVGGGEQALARKALSDAQGAIASPEFFLGPRDYVKLGFLLQATGAQRKGLEALERAREMALANESSDEIEEFIEAMKASDYRRDSAR